MRRNGMASAQRSIEQNGDLRDLSMKEVSIFELIARNIARFAAVSGVIALVIWLTWVMLDFEHMQSGFTLPQSVY